MGSKSSSSQQQVQQDQRIVAGEGAVVAKDGSSVQVLDNGAIQRAFDTADSSLKGALDFGTNALGFAKQTTNAAIDNLQVTQQLVADAYNDAKGRGALTDKLLIGAVAAMGLVAFAAVRRNNG